MDVKQESKPSVLRGDASDNTELDFTNAGDKVWLVKLPKFLFDKWTTASPGTELGHLKMNEANRREMKVVLNPTPPEEVKPEPTEPEEEAEEPAQAEDIDEAQAEDAPKPKPKPKPAPAPDIPLEYSLEMQNQTVTNTYIFSEPAARPWSDRPSRSGTPVDSDVEPGVDAAAQPEKKYAGGPDRSRKNLGGQRLCGKVVHDCLVKPIDNRVYRTLLRDRVVAADVPKRRVEVLDDATLSGNLMAPGSVKTTATTVKSFIKSKKQLKGRELHARMSLDNLLDEIVKCFKQYEYWSLKAFKAHLRQPESYLKETLENIAMLHKRGPMTGKWQLKAETRNAMKGFAGLSQFDKSTVDADGTATEDGEQKIKSEHEGEAAPEADESDEDIEMEDVL